MVRVTGGGRDSSACGGGEEDDLVFGAERSVEAVQFADVDAVDEDVEVAAQIPVGVEQVKLDGRIAPGQRGQQLGHGGGGEVRLAEVVRVIFQRGGDSEAGHVGIIILTEW